MFKNFLLVCMMVALLLIIAGAVFAAPYDYRNQEVSTPASTPEIQLPDRDRDGISDWFEENIAETDPEIYNARFAIVVFVDIGGDGGSIPRPREAGILSFKEPIREFFVERQKIPAENVFLLVGNWENGATLSNFQEAVAQIVERAD